MRNSLLILVIFSLFLSELCGQASTVATQTLTIDINGVIEGIDNTNWVEDFVDILTGQANTTSVTTTVEVVVDRNGNHTVSSNSGGQLEGSFTFNASTGRITINGAILQGSYSISTVMPDSVSWEIYVDSAGRVRGKVTTTDAGNSKTYDFVVGEISTIPLPVSALPGSAENPETHLSFSYGHFAQTYIKLFNIAMAPDGVVIIGPITPQNDTGSMGHFNDR